MPGYIGYTPQFNPVSLQEYMYVPTMTINEYKEAEKEFNDYQDKVAAVEALAGNNKKAMNIINQYKTYLGDAADGMTNGIKNVDSYKAARQARNYYRNSVMKLEPAITAFQNAQKTRAAKDDGTLIGPELSLDTYIDNPLYEDRFVHGSAIQKEAMQAAAAASARRKSERTPSKALGNQYWQLGSQVGFTPDEVNAWLADPTNNPELTTIANQIAEKYGEFDMNKVGQYITRGILDGIAYDNKTTYQTNKAYDAEYDYNIWKRKKQFEAEQAKATQGGEEQPVRRMPAKTNPIEGASTKAQRYAEFNQLLNEIKINPSILTASKPDPKLIENVISYDGVYKPEDQQKLNRYNRAKAQYDKRQRYNELLKELKQDYPVLNTDIKVSGMTTNQFGVPVPILSYDERLDNLTADIANRTAGYTFNATDAAYKQIVTGIPTFANIQGSDDKNTYIKDEKGKPVKNSKLRDIDFEKADVVFEDNQLQLRYDGNTYILEPGIFGYNDKAMRTELDKLWNSGRFDEYNEYMYFYLESIADDARNKIKGQSNTDSKLD